MPVTQGNDKVFNRKKTAAGGGPAAAGGRMFRWLEVVFKGGGFLGDPHNPVWGRAAWKFVSFSYI